MFVSRFLVTILLVRLMKLYILSDKVVFAVFGLLFVRRFCPYLQIVDLTIGPLVSPVAERTGIGHGIERSAISGQLHVNGQYNSQCMAYCCILILYYCSCVKWTRLYVIQKPPGFHNLNNVTLSFGCRPKGLVTFLM